MNIPFTIFGLLIALLISEPWYWKMAWAFVVCSTFYYGGFGHWGSWVGTKGIISLSQDALLEKKLNIFHADCLGGLGFAKRYADVITIFMLSGVTAIPMGIMLGKKSMAMGTVQGFIAAIFVAVAILAWGVFSSMASLAGRSSITSAITHYKELLLSDIANKKKDLILSGKDMKQLERLNVQEAAALKLKTSIFIGAGAWKDLFTLGASGLAFIKYIQEIQQIVGN